MKDRFSDRNNDLFKSIMSELDAVPPYDLDMENKTMEMIDVETDHSITIQKYRRWAKFGFFASIGFVLILFFISYRSILDITNLQDHQIEIQHYIPSFFALIGLVLIFVQMQLNDAIFKHNI